MSGSGCEQENIHKRIDYYYMMLVITKKQNVLKIDFVFIACYFEHTAAYIL